LNTIIYNKIKTDEPLDREDIKYILGSSNTKDLFDIAYEIKSKFVKQKVYFRGIVEFSNYCKKDCYYCGIRKGNSGTKRFQMMSEEIIETADWAYKNKYGSIVLQSGEREDKTFIDFIEHTILGIKEISNGELGITLSLGEQDYEVYKKWFFAGAHRYLLRIETSNKDLYSKIHPPDHSFDKRIGCIKSLQEIGYQVGTGVMIGLPNQTIDDLVNDLFFFKDIDIDMIGMGPYLNSENTPMSNDSVQPLWNNEEVYVLSLKMIALARILLKDINIASTTALQALKPFGREMGLKAGANIIMPNITPVEYREDYQLYDDKPCIDEEKELCLGCLDSRISGVDEVIGYGEWGDSPHFINR